MAEYVELGHKGEISEQELMEQIVKAMEEANVNDGTAEGL